MDPGSIPATSDSVGGSRTHSEPKGRELLSSVCCIVGRHFRAREDARVRDMRVPSSGCVAAIFVKGYLAMTWIRPYHSDWPQYINMERDIRPQHDAQYANRI